MSTSGKQEKADAKAAIVNQNADAEIKRISDKAFAEIASIQDRISKSSSDREIARLNREIGKIQDKLAKQVAMYEQARRGALGSVNARSITSEMEAKTGPLIATKNFGLAKIRFYENGYIQVNSSYPAKLMSIEATNSTTSKTAPGRALSQLAMAPLTGGLSLATSAISPRLRGTLSLVIATDAGAHVLTETIPHDYLIKAMYEIEGTGKGLIAKSKALDAISESKQATPSSTAKSLATELQELADLLAQGLITEQEFAQAKAKLLS